MTVAVSKALEDGATAVLCASTGNTAASAAAYAARAGLPAVVLTPEGRCRGGEARPDADARGDRAGGARRLRRGARGGAGARSPRVARARELDQSEPARRAEDRRARDRRGARRHRPTRSCCPTAAAETRRRTPRRSTSSGSRRRSCPSRRPIAARRSRARSGSAIPSMRRRCEASGARVLAVDDDELVATWRRLAAEEGLFCEPSSVAGLAAVLRGDVEGERSRRDDHGPRAQGSRRRRPPRAAARLGRGRCRRDRRVAGRAMIRLRAPATSANLGPGFDAAAVALELWNELELTDGEGVSVEGEGAGELAEDASNLAVRAYCAARRPRGQAVSLREPDPARARARLVGRGDRARARGGAPGRRRGGAARGRARRSRGHADNLAAALVGWRDAHLGGPDRADRRHASPRPGRGRPARADARPRRRAASLPSVVPHAEAAANAAPRGAARRRRRDGERRAVRRRARRPAARALPRLAGPRGRARRAAAWRARRNALRLGADRHRLGR